MDRETLDEMAQRITAAGPEAGRDFKVILQAMMLANADHEKTFRDVEDGDLTTNQQIALAMGGLHEVAVEEWQRGNIKGMVDDLIDSEEATIDQLQAFIPLLARVMTVSLYNGILFERGMQAVRAQERRSTARQSTDRAPSAGKPTSRPSRARGQRNR